MKTITIGRSAQNDIVVSDEKVSRTHLQIIQDDYGNFRLTDVGSTNGTFVNGRKVTGAVSLNPNDSIVIGDTTLPWRNYFAEHQSTPYSPPDRGSEPPTTTNWYAKAWKQYADFSGRARRKEYWLFSLVNGLILFVLYMAGLGMMASGDDTGAILFGILGVFFLVSFIPSIAVEVRRLHDIGKSGWWYWIALVPIIGGIWLLILLLTDSERGENEYGRNPKE
ncbi:hypothetical protein SAMD00024442_1_14 [Candidatus Symbiothrix dinenymphae]|nr:hypothetical protein SAMD00024442_1_14 [Candidatus Symbiothrix dinenymphae]